MNGKQFIRRYSSAFLKAVFCTVLIPGLVYFVLKYSFLAAFTYAVVVVTVFFFLLKLTPPPEKPALSINLRQVRITKLFVLSFAILSLIAALILFIVGAGAVLHYKYFTGITLIYWVFGIIPLAIGLLLLISNKKTS